MCSAGQGGKRRVIVIFQVHIHTSRGHDSSEVGIKSAQLPETHSQLCDLCGHVDLMKDICDNKRILLPGRCCRVFDDNETAASTRTSKSALSKGGTEDDSEVHVMTRFDPELGFNFLDGSTAMITLVSVSCAGGDAGLKTH